MKFNELLRAERKRAGKTLGDVARALNVSLPYLSDVERGTRPPLSPERIQQVAALLGSAETTIDLMHQAAGIHAKAFELSIPSSVKGKEAGAALQRGWETLSDEDYAAIVEMLNKRKQP